MNYYVDVTTVCWVASRSDACPLVPFVGMDLHTDRMSIFDANVLNKWDILEHTIHVLKLKTELFTAVYENDQSS